ncbi:unnamed protein product [Prunus brigantina]
MKMKHVVSVKKRPSPISGDEAGALGVETTGRIEESDQSPVSENSDSDSCMDEVDAIPPSAVQMP